VPVPKGIKSKQLNIQILKKKLVVGLKGHDAIIDGELCKEVKLDDSTWLIGIVCRTEWSYWRIYVDGDEVHIHLEKVNQMQWWENVITTHPKIDTTKIQPENSKLSDLDGETRSVVEKMMVSYFIRGLSGPD
jgi:hypothetical protein